MGALGELKIRGWFFTLTSHGLDWIKIEYI